MKAARVVVTPKAGQGNDDAPGLALVWAQRKTFGHEAVLLCPCCGEPVGVVTQTTGEPLSCGARVWVDALGPVRLLRRREAWEASSTVPVAEAGGGGKPPNPGTSP